MMGRLFVGVQHADACLQKKAPQNRFVAWPLTSHGKSGAQFSQHHKRKPDLIGHLNCLEY